MKSYFIGFIVATNLFAAGEFVGTSIGAKAQGLGGAFNVFVSDPSSLYWNPAGLSYIVGEARTVQVLDIEKEARNPFSDKELSDLMDEDLDRVQNIPQLQLNRTIEVQFHGSCSFKRFNQTNYFSAVGVTLPIGVIGAGILHSRSSKIAAYDEKGKSIGDIYYSGTAPYLGYAIEIGAVRFGLSGLFLYDNFDGDSLKGGAVNLGIQVQPIPVVSAGIAIRNIGVIQSFSNSKSIEMLDALFDFSTSIAIPFLNADLRFALGFSANLGKHDANLISNLGIYYGLNRYFHFMLGLKENQPSAGFGLDFNLISLSYSINIDKQGTGIQHFVESTMVF